MARPSVSSCNEGRGRWAARWPAAGDAPLAARLVGRATRIGTRTPRAPVAAPAAARSDRAPNRIGYAFGVGRPPGPVGYQDPARSCVISTCARGIARTTPTEPAVPARTPSSRRWRSRRTRRGRAPAHGAGRRERLLGTRGCLVERMRCNVAGPSFGLALHDSAQKCVFKSIS